MKTNANALIIAVAVIVAAYLFANAFQNRNQSADTISVTGLGKKDFVSDLIVWSGSFSKKSMILKDAYASLDSDREKIKSYLLSKGIQSNEVVFSARKMTIRGKIFLEEKFFKVHPVSCTFQFSANSKEEAESLIGEYEIEKDGDDYFLQKIKKSC